MNYRIYRRLVTGTSMRDTAVELHISRTTVARKKKFFELKALSWLKSFREQRKFQNIQFDDLETFEHSKCKPVSVTLVVEKGTRLILGFRVAKMPAKGRLAKKSRKKYGIRADRRKPARRSLFREIKPCISEGAVIQSDMNPHYISDVKEFFPNSPHVVYKGRRGCVVGQGELKAGGFDPLFSLNHTCAMLRAKMNRLFRRTWCTSKNCKGLSEHLALYAMSHNRHILRNLELKHLKTV